MTLPASILFSGDSPLLKNLIADIIIKNPQSDIDTAKSGEKALQAASKKNYDVIISFFSLPDTDGISLYNELRKNKTESPFILIFGSGNEKEILKALSDGAEFYVQEEKPQEILIPELAEKVSKISAQSNEGEMLGKPEDRALAYFNKSPEGIFVADGTGHFTDVNPAACKMTGYLKKELLKLTIQDIHDESSLKSGMETFKKVSRTGHATGEFLSRRKDGSKNFLSLALVKSGPDEYVAFCRDITETKNTLEALKESEERYRSLFNGVPDYVIVYRNGKILFANSAVSKILGLNEKHIIGKDLLDFVAQESRDMVISMVKKRVKGEIIPSYEIGILTKDGPRISEVHGSIIKYEGEAASLIVLTDITDTKHSEEYSRLLSKMSDDAPASIIVHDFSGKIIYANEEALRLHGFTRSEFMALNLYDINDPESEKELNERIKTIDETGELDYDARHFRKDSSIIPLHVNVKIVEWENRKVLLNIATDLTERKKVENLLKEQNLFLQQLIDTIPSPIFYKDKNGIYLGCNTAFEEYTGLSKDQVIGKSVYDLSQKELADVYMAHDQALFDNPGVDTYEAGVKYADGSVHDVIFYKATFKDIKGDVVGLVGVILDISDRKKIEDALKKSEEKFKSYVESAREGIFVVDTSGKIVDVNPGACELLGYTREELLNLNISTLVPPEDIEFVMSRFKETAKTGHISEEFRTKRKDGGIVPVIISAVKMPDGNILAIHTNISELKRAEDGVKEANRKLNLLSSITRHDILNQLTVVIAYLELIEMDDKIPADSKTKEYLEKISGASQTIKRQILFTKDYSELGEQTPKWQNVGAIVDETAKNSAFEGISVENNLKDLEIYADPLFEKVIYNLFDNAVKHGEKTRIIRFGLIDSKNSAAIICEDDGMGVPDDFKDKIFKRQHYTNTGLGLFLSGEILSITGITMKETGIFGKGARFEINVPKGMYHT